MIEMVKLVVDVVTKLRSEAEQLKNYNATSKLQIEGGPTSVGYVCANDTA
jgi:hypothetical protein